MLQRFWWGCFRCCSIYATECQFRNETDNMSHVRVHFIVYTDFHLVCVLIAIGQSCSRIYTHKACASNNTYLLNVNEIEYWYDLYAIFSFIFFYLNWWLQTIRFEFVKIWPFSNQTSIDTIVRSPRFICHSKTWLSKITDTTHCDTLF